MIKEQNSHYPLIKLPDEVQLTLCLIKEELKSRKFFHALHEVGLDDCYYQPHLGRLILQSMGMDDDVDEIFNRYDAIMEKRSRKIEAGNDRIMKQVMKAYMELHELRSLVSKK